MSDFYPTPAHSDPADSRESKRARSAHPHERTRDPLIDHPRPALPRCCRLPPLPHRCCQTALATWARLGCSYADDVTLLLPRHCYLTAILILPRRRYRAADATLLPLPHCRCGHTAADCGCSTASCPPMPHPPLSCPPMTRPLLLPHRRLHACRCHTRRFPVTY